MAVCPTGRCRSMKTTRTHKKPSKGEIRNAILDSHFGDLTDRAIARQLGVSNRTVSLHRKWLENRGKILPRVKSTQTFEACLYEVCTSLIRPAPANDKLYDPVNEEDPKFLSLVEDIETHG